MLEYQYKIYISFSWAFYGSKKRIILTTVPSGNKIFKTYSWTFCPCVICGYIYYPTHWIRSRLVICHHVNLVPSSFYSRGLNIWMRSRLHLLNIIRKVVCLGWFFSLSLERIDFLWFLLSRTLLFPFLFFIFFFFRFATTIHSFSLRVFVGLWGFLVGLWGFLLSHRKKPFSGLNVSSCLCIPTSTKLPYEKTCLLVSAFVTRPQKNFIT